MGRVRRAAPAIFLLVFAPVGAEYLIGYDDITGDLTAMVFGLVIFGPLYGAPAVLIREAARRGSRLADDPRARIRVRPGAGGDDRPVAVQPGLPRHPLLG